MTPNIVLFYYRNACLTDKTNRVTCTSSDMKYLLLQSALRILPSSPTFRFFEAVLQFLVTTLIWRSAFTAYLHTYIHRTPVNEGLLPSSEFLEHLGLSQKERGTSIFWTQPLASGSVLLWFLYCLLIFPFFGSHVISGVRNPREMGPRTARYRPLTHVVMKPRSEDELPQFVSSDPTCCCRNMEPCLQS